MRTFIVAVILVIASSAETQAQTCTIPPTFTITPGNPVLLTFSHQTGRNLRSPLVTINGTQIVVHQLDLDVPPPPGPGGPPVPCNHRTVSLGTLQSGTYSVAWNYSVSSGLPGGQPTPLETFLFSFHHGSVPALDGTALLGLALLLGMAGMVLLRR